ncbi:MAG: porin family protein [Gammaproteobacteria bacterium]|nr:porin family protein [Gammaproteobacteria bacterium]
MINTKHVCTLLALIAVSSTAQAQGGDGSNWYLTGVMGAVSGSRSAGNIRRDLENSGITATELSIDDNRTGWTLNIGYEVTENLAVEAGYIDMGDVSLTLNTMVTDVDLFINQVKNVHPNSADGVTLAGVYRYHINDKISLSGRLGLFRWDGDFDAIAIDSGEKLGSDDSSGTDMFYGVGGGFKMTDKLTITIQWQHFKLEKESLRMLSIGARYRF